VIYRKIYAFYCIYFALLTARRIKLNDRIKNVFDVAREFIAVHSFFFKFTFTYNYCEKKWYEL